MANEAPRTLHIYPQPSWHEEAWVVGNRAALEALRDTISRALESNKPEGATMFANDGEGYQVLIVPVDESGMDSLKLPYHDEPTPWKGRHPVEIIGATEYRRIMRG
jgi:hypothetical protein